MRPTAAGAGLDAGHLEGGRARRRDRGLPHRQHAASASKKSAICGSRCWPAARRPTSDARARCCDPAAVKPPYRADGGAARRRDSRRRRAGSTSPSGTASAASPSATATRSSCSPRPASRWRAISPRSSRRCDVAEGQRVRARRRDRRSGRRRLSFDDLLAAHPSRREPRAQARGRDTGARSSSSTCWSTSAASRWSTARSGAAERLERIRRQASARTDGSIRLSPATRKHRRREKLVRRGAAASSTASSPSGSIDRYRIRRARAC